jgi:hypothetical protein
MMTALSILNSVLALALLPCFVWFAVWLNRRLKLNLRSLRWIAIYIGSYEILGLLVTPLVVRAVVDGRHMPFGRAVVSFVAALSIADGILRTLGYSLVFLMAVSELAPVIARGSQDMDLQGFDPLHRVRDRMSILGFALVATALLPLALALGLLWLA